jgi:hypothetical protein
VGVASLYRFYNMEVGRHGIPFPLCAEHRSTQLVPESCILEKIAERSAFECLECLDRRPGGNQARASRLRQARREERQ